MQFLSSVILTTILAISGCKYGYEPSPSVHEQIWGQHGNQEVKLITLTNISGMQIRVTNYGAPLTYVSVADRKGVFENVVLGFDSLSQYLAGHPMFGSVIGRYANRIQRY